MGDENFDLCEYVWGHELSMRRLLSMLRGSQNHCTDNECFVEGNTQQENDPNADFYIFMTIFLAMAFMIQTWLSQNRRTGENPINKPQNGHEHDSNGSPPAMS